MASISRKPIIIVLTIILLLVILATAGLSWYLLSRPVVLFVQDSSYSQTSWPYTRSSFAKTVRKAG